MNQLNIYAISAYCVSAILIYFYYFAIHDAGKRITKSRLRKMVNTSQVSTRKKCLIYMEVVAYATLLFIIAYFLITDINKSIAVGLSSLILFVWGVTDRLTEASKNETIA